MLGLAFPQTQRDGRLAWLGLEALVRIAELLVDNGVLRVCSSSMDTHFVVRRLARQ
jgi:hypothetical protein